MMMSAQEINWSPFAVTLATIVFGSAFYYPQANRNKETTKRRDENDAAAHLSVLPCIRNRRSIFPKKWLKNPQPLDDSVIRSLLDAAMWAPFHGKCFGNQSPAKFIVLGKEAMVEMQKVTLQYYDENWEKVGWGSGKVGTRDEYEAWREMTEDEITGRWAPCTHMIAIVMRRQSGPKRLPQWEEAAAVAAATQNMHLQSTKFRQLACYWSSWHEAARDSDEMKEFLKMDAEDKCMGFFCVAQRDVLDGAAMKDRRIRDRSIMQVEWRK
mmetsp:Transcript_25296/g.30601  ORF Transcript_25296/g.30601 Transcript_25296/m.30601 type:complete len:268 (+) Transcript_25296:56-859(+)|eukprot:CAMPEP_0172483652 /NCGR_PEP_ID=MMETSP1066-20121228/10711_1 /TAXON_ID=671091 /ORGANISM="Coscinodiscus wailesii, Strain CCMP2513" /LENGTH=267 /DNA_ID=CAMNT_0013247639 /DNA_START=56 /DNA_END=859 /DNA_ORIENTATION=-